MFSVGILGTLLGGSVFFGLVGVALITDPVLPGTILNIGIASAVFLVSDLDYINFLLPTWVVSAVLSVWVIVWTVRRSDDGPNKYGPDPRTATSQQPYKP